MKTFFRQLQKLQLKSIKSTETNFSLVIETLFLQVLSGLLTWIVLMLFDTPCRLHAKKSYQFFITYMMNDLPRSTEKRLWCVLGSLCVRRPKCTAVDIVNFILLEDYDDISWNALNYTLKLEINSDTDEHFDAWNGDKNARSLFYISVCTCNAIFWLFPRSSIAFQMETEACSRGIQVSVWLQINQINLCDEADVIRGYLKCNQQCVKRWKVPCGNFGYMWSDGFFCVWIFE